MNELVKVEAKAINGVEKQFVNGRDLHEFLQVGRDYTSWVKSRCEQYGFEDGKDYLTHRIGGASFSHGGHNKITHDFSMNMAKELSMVENNERGKQARRYFIECEEGYHKAQNAADILLQAMNNPEYMLKLMGDIAEKTKRVQMLEAKVTEDKPLVEFAKHISTSDAAILIGDYAKVLCKNGVQVGQNRLFYWMRDNGYLFKDVHGNNKAYQQYIDSGLFECTELLITTPKGTKTRVTTKLTGKGQLYFSKKVAAAFGGDSTSVIDLNFYS